MTKPLVQSTGRRKRAIARVCLRPGEGKITVNGRDLVNYMPSELQRMVATEPLRVTGGWNDLPRDGGEGRRAQYAGNENRTEHEQT